METEKNARISELADKARSQQPEGGLEPGTKIKGKRGRKPLSEEEKAARQAEKENAKKQAEPERPPPVPTSLVIKPIVNIASTAVSSWVEDDRARMRPEELDAAAEALGAVLDRYLPDLFNKYGPELACLMIFGQYGLRVMAIKKLKDIEKKKKEEFENKNNFQKEPQIVSPFPVKTETVQNVN